MTDEHDPTDDLDAIGRRAGAELRRPAPPDGAALVQRSVRRRRAMTAVGGGIAVAVIVAGGLVLVGQNDDDTVVTDDRVSTTVAPDPSVAPEPSLPVEPTVPPDTSPAPATSVARPAEPDVSDEVLPDPLAFASDGFERVLDGRSLIVRSDPEQVIPLDLVEPELWLYGVGPNGVAYLRADAAGLTRILAVPTTGAAAGTVYDLVEPYVHEGPWLGFMTPEGIDPFTTTGGPGIVPYVGPDGQPLADPIDPTFTWRVEYRFLDDGTGAAQPVVIDSSGTVHELPVTEPGREGQFDAAVRPLPDGRVTVTVLPADGPAEVWAFDPTTATWTVHPSA
jgi:hypothetical protein